MTAIAAPKNYAAFFQNTAEDPIGVGDDAKPILAGIYHSWRATNTPPDASALLAETLNHFEEQAIGGVGIFVRDSAGVHRLRIIHGIRKFPGSLGLESSLKNCVFGYLDDVDEGVPEIVQLNETLFGLTGTVNVATLAHHKSTLESEPDTVILPVRGNDEAQTESIKARISAFIPFSLVPLLIEKNLNAREAFLIVAAHIDALGAQAECAPLLAFLRVAGTYSAADSVANSLMEPGPTFRSEKQLTKYMMRKVLYRDLPELRGGGVARPDAATAALTSAVATLTDHQVRADEANQRRREEEDKPKTITESFGSLTAQRLLVMCQKELEEELPILYTRLANKKKREDFVTIVQQTVEEAAELLGGGHVPVITPGIMGLIKSFRFHGNDDTDIGSGVLPLAFVPPGGNSGKARARRVEANESATLYGNMMSTEGQHISSADAQALSKTKGYVPSKWTEATVQLKAYLPVLASMVGTNHPLFRAYQRGVNLYADKAIMIQEALDDRVGERLGPGLFVYSFQIKLKGWFENQWGSREQFRVPDFEDGLWRYLLERNLEWLPSYQEIPELVHLSRPVAPELAPAPSGAGGSGGGGRTGPKGPSATSNPAQERVVNTKPDPRLREHNEMCTRIREWKVGKAVKAMLAKGKAVPTDEQGRDRCLTFHLKGACFTGCKHKHDHKPITSGAGADKLYEWCQEAYA